MDITPFRLRWASAKASTPPRALDAGGLRVLMSMKNLKSLGLEIGDYCLLDQPNGNPKAVGVAWNTKADPKDQNRIAFIEEPLKDLFGLKLEDKVTVSKFEPQRLRHAQKIHIQELEPGSIRLPNEALELLAKVALWSLDAVLPNGTFAVTHPRSGRKVRFLISQVEPPAEEPHVPYYCDYKSEVCLLEAGQAVSTTTAQEPTKFKISAEGIGGLHRQVLELNERLMALTNTLRRQKYPTILNTSTGVLIHGPSGTGKSLLLRRLSEAPWRKVINVEEPAGSSEKSHSALRKAFDEAVKAQPSLLVFEKLENFAPRIEDGASSRVSLAGCIAAEIEKLGTARVMVVGTTTKLVNVDPALRTPQHFSDEIEVPVPESGARVEILKVLQDQDWPIRDWVADEIGGRTHGFVGRDLAALYKKALKRAVERLFEQEKHSSADGLEQSFDAMKIQEQEEEDTQKQRQEQEDAQEPVGSVLDDEDFVYQEPAQVKLEDFEAALLQVRPTAMNEVFLETPKVRWSDIGGSDSVKQALREVTEWPYRYADDMGTLDLQPQRGILLYGPPGCSKTLCAKAIATESSLNFLAVKGAELTSMYVGETERAVRDVFSKARAASPSILFFDEIDSIAASRTSGSHLSGMNVLTTLLNEMDGIESLKGVLVLAATNRPEILDPALMRPGRFDAILYVGPPGLEARRQILNVAGMRRRPLGDDVNLDVLAERLEGYSGAEIVEVCAEAARTRLRRRIEKKDTGIPYVESADFEAALEKVPKRITAEMVEAYEQWSVGDVKRL
ncbi:AAA family ATPase [Phyllosticta citrichinensis]|uniref:AAA family ATPase n=1 Tax=Phyllosticta citrichinensis TaxID=1130410 RepID=A0ABR1XWM8_9PEZI